MAQAEQIPPLTRSRLVAFSLLTSILFFGGAELAARLFAPGRCGSAERMADYLKQSGITSPASRQQSLTRSVPMPYDPYLIWHLIPDFQGENLGVVVTHNSSGLRSPEIPLEKPPGTVRVLLLGDSTTYGHGVETDAMLRAGLERSLQAALPGKQVQVVNGGVPGYSSLQSLNLLRRVASRYSPDVVVVLNLWSDCILDQFEDKEVIYGAGFKSRVNRIGQQIDEALAPSSALYCVLKQRVFKVQQSSCPGQPPLCAPPPEKAHGNADAPAFNQVRQPGASTPDKAVPRVSLADYRENLETIAAFARRHGAAVAFAMPANRRDVGEQDDRQPTPDQYQPYRKTLREVAAALNAPFIDLPAAFAARAQSSPPLFMDLVHPTAAGNAIMSDALGKALLEDPTTRKALRGE